MMNIRMDRARGNRKRRGFSLLEMMLVVACLAIVALLVLPSAGDSDAVVLRAAGRLLVADLEYAQMQSMGNGADPCVVVFDPGQSQYHLARLSASAVPLTDAAMALPYISRFGQGRAQSCAGVTLEDVSVGADLQLGFTPAGALDQGVDATITLRSGVQTIQIVVNAATGECAVK